MKSRKIIFVIDSLGGGGAEKMLVLLLKHLNSIRFNFLVITFQPENKYQEDFPPDVPIICLNKKSRFDFLRIVRNLAHIIKRENPALILSFLTYTNFLTVLACKFIKQRIPLLINEATILSLSLKAKRFTLARKILVRYLYPKTSSIIAVSKGVKNDLVVNYGIQNQKISVIYNGIDTERIRELAGYEFDYPLFKKNIPLLISSGRLIKQKNHSFLLKAVKLVLKKRKIKLLLLGEGKERPKMECYAKKLGISENVYFLGFKKNPFKYITKSNIFVLPSLWEGFGNVIIEAMACGTPVISTSCPSGPVEIIEDGINGILVESGNAEEMAQAILKLLKDESLKERLVKSGKKRAEYFGINKMKEKYEHLFEKWINN